MNQTSDARIRELESRLQQLETENEQLLERAEETLLLGQISEAIAEQSSIEKILLVALEKISLLKDIPACLALKPGDGAHRIFVGYYSYTRQTAIGQSVSLPEDMQRDLSARGTLFHGAEGPDLSHMLLLPKGLTAGASLCIHHASDIFADLIFVFVLADTDDADRLKEMTALLQRLTEMLIHAAERLLMVTTLQQMNIELDRKVEQRTADLQDSENRFRQLVDQAPDSIFLIGDDSKILNANRTASQILGYEHDELIGMHVPDIDVTFTREGIVRLNQGVEQNDSITIEGIHRCKDGSTFPAEIHVSRIMYGNESRILAIARDISERKKAESTILLHQRAMDAAADGILIADATSPEMPVIYCNKAAQSITGYTADEIIGRNCRFLQNGESDQPEVAIMHRAIEAGHGCTVTLRNYRKDGSMFWNEVSLSPVFDDDGRLIEYIGIQSDVSRERELEDQLAQAQKMDAIGTLVGGIAHDFNNMLAGIMGNLYLIQHDKAASGELRQRAGRINDLCERAAAMISQMLAFARKGHVAMEAVDFHAFMHEGLELAKMSIPESIEVVEDFEDDSPLQVYGDITRLQQVLLNLMVNARDAMEHVQEPVIHIDVRRHELAAGLNEIHEGLGEGPWLELAVSDNGSGIPAESLERIFEPFYTTKEVGKGTGLGMSMVYGVVQSHQGAIHIDSEVGQGTCISIYLPLSGEQYNEQDDSPTNVQHGHGETILLVDDEAVVRTSGKDLLEFLGYVVETACNGREALEHAALGRADLVLMDVVMPKLGGVDAAKQMRKQYPELPIIFATGYDRGQVLQGLTDFEYSRSITKPFRMKILSAALHDLLTGGTSA
ncbi:MAG: PAS domain S-box protein [Mariprofundaceae bacterium]